MSQGTICSYNNLINNEYSSYALLHNSCVVLWSVSHVSSNLMMLADVVLCMLAGSFH
jgi:hypothetical protein